MTLSFVSLAVLIGAPVFYYLGRIDSGTDKIIMNTATAVWFATSIFWMGRERKEA